MKKIFLLISMSILFAALITPVYSSDHKKKHHYNGHFGDMDTNGDDQVNWEEFKTFFHHAEKNIFEKADENSNGSVDHDEWHDFKEKKGYKCKD